ncbi:MAG: hypothetical protein JNJ85_00495 [Candidatus Kapabacteria bacterium]|nr:hypothetical protein [Candidatus Kapabacteria bacterium]
MATKKAAKKAVAKKGAAKKPAAKKAVAKKAPAKKAAPKKAVAKKGAAKKPAAKKAVAKKAPAKKVAPKKTVAKKPVAKKAAPKKVAPAKTVKKGAAPKTVVKKSAVPKPVVKKETPKKVEAPKPQKATPKVEEVKVQENKPIAVVEPPKPVVATKGSSLPTRGKGMSASSRTKNSKANKNKELMDSLFEATQAAPKSTLPRIAPPESSRNFVTPEPVKPKPNVRYSDKELAEFKVIIENEREKTLDELRMLKERLEDLTNYEASEETAVYSMHMAEQGSEAVEREKTYAQIQRMNDYLRKLDEAGKRIDDKTYGICRQCGILIAKERLLAVPITTLSASWKLRQQCPVDGIDRIGK